MVIVDCPHCDHVNLPVLQVYATSDVLEANSAVHCPQIEMASRSKLSCVSWNSYIKHLLLAADYDGCLALWDAEANACTATFEEHAKRVWSADFSQVLPFVIIVVTYWRPCGAGFFWQPYTILPFPKVIAFTSKFGIPRITLLRRSVMSSYLTLVFMCTASN